MRDGSLVPVIASCAHRRVRAWLLIASCLALAVSCDRPPPTELLVRVDTDFPVAGDGPDAIDAIVVRVLRVETSASPTATPIDTLDAPPVGTPVTVGDEQSYTFRFMRSFRVGPEGSLLPIELPVVPEGWDARRRVLVQAFAMRGTTVAASAQARLGFVHQKALSVYLYIWRRCDGIHCNPEETCYRATCVPDRVDEACLPTSGGTLPPECDGGLLPFVDVGPRDAGPDADGGELPPPDLGLDLSVPDEDAGCVCGSDGVECTVDACDDTGACLSLPDDSRCVEEQHCDPRLGCVPDVACDADADCDDGDACTLDACDAEVCRNEPMACNDGDPCTVDACSGTTGECAVTRATDGTPCGAGARCCAGTCAAFDSQTDCAVCGRRCGGNETCGTSECECDMGFQDCDHLPGCESNTSSDPTHCGRCENACTGATPSCIDGTCRMCASSADCNDDLPCTSDTCDGAGRCQHAAIGAGCFIGGSCVAEGAQSPASQCQSCQSAVSRTAWSNRTGPCNDANACTTGDRCTAGTCGGTSISCTGLPCAIVECFPITGCSLVGVAPGQCMIGGQCYAAGDLNPIVPELFPQPCQTICDPTTSQTSWTRQADGTPCNDHLYCTTLDACIGGVCRGSVSPCGEGPSPSCTLSCAERARGFECIGTATGSWCFIDGQCVHESWNAAHPTNHCLGCEPSIDHYAWSPRRTNGGLGEPCNDQLFCTNGERCTLDADPACTGGVPMCDDGIACTVDVCNEGTNRCSTPTLMPGFCLIAGVCQAAGEREPGNQCRSCDPSASPTSWSNRPEGAPCGPSQTCCAGSCTGCTDTSCGCDPCETNEFCNTDGPACFCDVL